MDTTAQPRIDGTSTTRPAEDSALPPPEEIWTRAFDRVRRRIDVPTVWIAMQSTKPLGVEGSYFIGALSRDDWYLATNLQSHENSLAIEEALYEITGRILAFRLIEGATWADWEAEKAHVDYREAQPRAASKAAAPPPPVAPPPVQPTVPPPTAPRETSAYNQAAPRPQPTQINREVYKTWEALSEALTRGVRTAPLMKFPQGQARFLMQSVQTISDTMDVLLANGGVRDDTFERQLARIIERLGNGLGSLDPIFVGLELLRYRQFQGKDIGLPD